ncbi:lymphocyte antigen 6A-2/6E-1-like [Dipodomys merriami]|uniref:lymphocyte antigen 6A-2/6E-1-like n=1 Tax=Dipodomys merriami TaxID=94247 RepID=UPI003855A7A5
MAPFVIILLAALLCAERAQSLQCYQCVGATQDSTCKPSTCPFPNGVCVTQEVGMAMGSRKVKNKFCLPTCPKGKNMSIKNIPLIGKMIHSKTSCCSEDLCNLGVPVQVSTWMLAGVLLLGLGVVRLGFWL